MREFDNANGWPRVLVPAWPKIVVTLLSSTEGTVSINGTEHPCEGASASALRASLLARSVTVAQTLARAVRVEVRDGESRHLLGVRPDGIVQALEPDGCLAAADDLKVMVGQCRACGQPVAINLMACPACEAEAPLTADAAKGVTSTHAAVASSVGIAPAARSPEGVGNPLLPAEIAPRQVIVELVGHFTVAATVPLLLGRNPSAQFGHSTLALPTKDRTLSRTHAVVNIDEANTVTIADCGSANGTVVEGLGMLSQGQPVAIDASATITLGDAKCRIRRL